MDPSSEAWQAFKLLVKGDSCGVAKVLPAVDADELLRFAYAHRLGAFTFQRLERLGGLQLLSHGELMKARASALIEQKMSQELSHLLPELHDLFKRNGIRVLFMKGPAFAQRFYGGIEGRGFVDVDLLLRRPADLALTELLLKERGFQPMYRILVSHGLSRYFTHHFGYQRGKLPLEVHWALQRHFTFAFDYERVWSTSGSVLFAGRTYEVISDEYELVLQIVGVLTDLQVGKLVVRSIVDIYRILSVMGDQVSWQGFFRERARENIVRPSVFVLSLVLDLMDGHDEFPLLSQFLVATRERLPSSQQAYEAVFHSEKRKLGQKALALRLYEAPFIASFAWWLVSLPFRTAVYAAGHGRSGKAESTSDMLQ